MQRREFWLWTIRDERTGEPRRTRHRMTEADALASHPGAQKVPGSVEVRLCPETPEEQMLHAASAPWPSFRLLACGGRDYVDRERVFRALDAADKRRHVTTIIHGDYRGADALAKAWAIERRREQLPFPADWNRYGHGAGPIRNQQMIDEGKPDAVVALPGGTGTADMIMRAEAAGLPVWRPYG